MFHEMTDDQIIRLQFEINKLTIAKKSTYEYINFSSYYHRYISKNNLTPSSYLYYYELEQIFINKFLDVYHPSFDKQTYLQDSKIRFDPYFINLIKLITTTKKYKINNIDVQLGYVPTINFKMSVHDNYEPNASCIINDSGFNPLIGTNVEFAKRFINRIQNISWTAIQHYYNQHKLYWFASSDDDIAHWDDCNDYADQQAMMDINDKSNKEHLVIALEKNKQANTNCENLAFTIASLDDGIFNEMVKLHGDDKQTLIHALIDINEIKSLFTK